MKNNFQCCRAEGAVIILPDSCPDTCNFIKTWKKICWEKTHDVWRMRKQIDLFSVLSFFWVKLGRAVNSDAAKNCDKPLVPEWESVPATAWTQPATKEKIGNTWMTCRQCCGSALVSMRIRIQHFRIIWISGSRSKSGFRVLINKIGRKLSWKKIIIPVLLIKNCYLLIIRAL